MSGNSVSRMTCFVLLGFCSQLTFSLNLEKEIALTPKEKTALDEIKRIMIPKIPRSSYVNKFAKDDLYFLKWLLANDFKVTNTEKQLLNHLSWRAREKIDTIDKEDWASFIKEYPLFLDTLDKQGRPIVEVLLSEWNIRDAVLKGKLGKVIRFVTYFMEIQTRQLFEARANGDNATQAIFLTDVEGANIMKQVCPNCLPAFSGAMLVLRTHYPYLWHRIYVVNMPPPFEVVVRLAKRILRPSTRNAIRTYVSKNQWLPILDQTIDKDQRSVRFGGTIVRD